MISGKIVLLALIATVSAQFNTNNNYDQYDNQANLQRSQSFLGTQRSGNQFGVQSGLTRTDSRFGLNNQFNRNLNNNQFGSSSISQFRSGRLNQNQFGRNDILNQFNRQNTFGRNNQQFSRTGEAAANVISSRSDNDGLGQYSFGFETDNGITREETGVPTGFDTHAVSGSYSYTSPEGVEVIVRYTADENGFQVESPNVPAIPPHAQQQIEAAREAKARGLIDENGNPTGFNQGSQFRSLNNNNLQTTSNLQNLVNQNRNFRNQQFNSQSRFNNGQRTTVLRRPFSSSNIGNNQLDAFGNQQQDFSGRNFQSSRLTQERFGANLNRPQFRNSNSFTQAGQIVTTPSFQNQIASRLTVQEGSNFRSSQDSDLLYGSQIPSGATGNVASYRIGSK